MGSFDSFYDYRPWWIVQYLLISYYHVVKIIIVISLIRNYYEFKRYFYFIYG